MSGEFVLFLTRVGRALRAFGRAHEELWARLETMDPRPGADDLGWEPTASGWRLVGSYLPDVPPSPPGARSPSR